MEHEISPFAFAGGIGILLALGWIAVNVLCWIWNWSWAWIDDSDPQKSGAIIHFLALSRGFKIHKSEYFKYRSECGEYSNGWLEFFAPMVILCLGPTIFLIAFLLYPITLSIFGLYLTARLARFARRHKKLFDKHIKDPEAHK